VKMQSSRRRSNPVAGRALAGPLSGAAGIGRLHSARPGPETVSRPSLDATEARKPGPGRNGLPAGARTTRGVTPERTLRHTEF